MTKALKWIGILIGVALLLVVAVIAAVPLFFNPNDYKPEISAAAKEATGRDLTIDGDIELSLFPWIGIKLGKVEFSNAAGFDSTPFARISNAEVKLKLLPLFKQEVVMKAVTLHGLNVNLQIAANGTSNWDDLAQPTDTTPATTEITTEAGAPSTAPLAALAIGGLNIGDAKISYDDKSTNSRYSIEQLNLTTGPVSLTTPIDIKLSTLFKSNQPELNGQLQLATKIGFDLNNKRYTLNGTELNLEANGPDLPGGKATLQLKADIAADLKAQTAKINALQLNSIGLALTGAFDIKQLMATPHFNGQIKLAEFNPKTLMQAMAIEAPITADPNALTKASIELEIDGNPSTINIKSFIIKLDESRLTGNATTSFSANAAMPAIRYSLNLDSIDADRYLPPATEGKAVTPVTPATAGAAVVTLPTDTLRNLNINGKTTLEKLKISGLNVSDIHADVKAKDGLIRFHPLSAKLYQGQYKGNVQLDVRGDTPKISLNESLQGIEAGPLLKDFMDDDMISGKGSFRIKLTASGTTQESITKTLNGNGNLSFKNGSVKGFNLAQLVRETKARINKQPAPDKTLTKTDFSALTGSFNIQNGIVSNPDLLVKSPYVRIGGKGKINLPKETIDYRVNAKVVKTEQGQGGAELESIKGLDLPVKISGTFANPKFRLELDKVLKAKAKEAPDKEKARIKQEAAAKLEAKKKAAREKLEQQKQELKQKTKDKLKKKLKGLFR